MTLRLGVAVEQFWHRVPGGTGRATRKTLAALTDVDHDGLSLAPVAAWHRRSARSMGEPLTGITHLPLPRPLLYEGWIRGWGPAIERWTGPLDIVWAPAMVPVSTAAPLVTTVHDLDFFAAPDRLSRRGRSFFPRAFEAVVTRSVAIVCPSEVVAADCVRHGIERDRLRVVPWGVEPPTAGPDDAAALLDRLGLSEGYVLFVGTVEPRKNLAGLVAALTARDDVALVVVGPSGWNVDAEAAIAPLGDRARWLGPVSDADLSALYLGAGALAMPSHAEGFGLPVLEAMAHGTPVVTSAGTATDEVAGGAAALVDPGDPDSIGAGIDLALERGPTTMRRVAEGRARAASLSWSTTASGYRDVFLAAAGR